MNRCRQIGHKYGIVNEDDYYLSEKCEDCGYTKSYRKKDRDFRKDYDREHYRDFIQPFQEREWDMSWGYDDKIKRIRKEQEKRLKRAKDTGNRRLFV